MRFNEQIKDIYQLCTVRREVGSKITSLVSEKSYDVKAAICIKHSQKSSSIHHRESNLHHTGTSPMLLPLSHQDDYPMQ